MHVTIKALKAYHNSIGLHIDMYHLDSGFWHSAHADGHCDGVTAANWSASEFHWPHVDQIGDGLGEPPGGGGTNHKSWTTGYQPTPTPPKKHTQNPPKKTQKNICFRTLCPACGKQIHPP